jgi:hypothetical protein
MDPSIEWLPVAELLDRASKELDVGQMLHTSVFSLFEAMSAVEIGNQKMDPGLLLLLLLLLHCCQGSIVSSATAQQSLLQ